MNHKCSIGNIYRCAPTHTPTPHTLLTPLTGVHWPLEIQRQEIQSSSDEDQDTGEATDPHSSGGRWGGGPSFPWRWQTVPSHTTTHWGMKLLLKFGWITRIHYLYACTIVVNIFQQPQLLFWWSNFKNIMIFWKLTKKLSNRVFQSKISLGP